MKILIIDDDDDVRQIARLSLGRLGGMDVIEAGGGEEGCRKARDERPDGILLDMMMPVMDGPATLAALHGDPRTADIPVIFLTAKALPAEVARLMTLGSRGVLTKPFDPKVLVTQVKDLLTGADTT